MKWRRGTDVYLLPRVSGWKLPSSFIRFNTRLLSLKPELKNYTHTEKRKKERYCIFLQRQAGQKESSFVEGLAQGLWVFWTLQTQTTTHRKKRTIIRLPAVNRRELRTKRHFGEEKVVLFRILTVSEHLGFGPRYHINERERPTTHHTHTTCVIHVVGVGPHIHEGPTDSLMDKTELFY